MKGTWARYGESRTVGRQIRGRRNGYDAIRDLPLKMSIKMTSGAEMPFALISRIIRRLLGKAGLTV